MGKWSVRIENIILENFKNVKYGEINLENKKSDYKASILGLYGQNGSGKTALIDRKQPSYDGSEQYLFYISL